MDLAANLKFKKKRLKKQTSQQIFGPSFFDRDLITGGYNHETHAVCSLRLICIESQDNYSFFWLSGVLLYIGMMEMLTFYTSSNQSQNS